MYQYSLNLSVLSYCKVQSASALGTQPRLGRSWLGQSAVLDMASFQGCGLTLSSGPLGRRRLIHYTVIIQCFFVVWR